MCSCFPFLVPRRLRGSVGFLFESRLLNCHMIDRLSPLSHGAGSGLSLSRTLTQLTPSRSARPSLAGSGTYSAPPLACVAAQEASRQTQEESSIRMASSRSHERLGPAENDGKGAREPSLNSRCIFCVLPCLPLAVGSAFQSGHPSFVLRWSSGGRSAPPNA